MAKKPKFEKLALNMRRGGELRFDTAYNAPEAARLAVKHARKGWDVEVTAGGAGTYGASKRKSVAFMSCTPSARKAYWSDPDGKAHAKCTMTPAFKKRVRGR